MNFWTFQPTFNSILIIFLGGIMIGAGVVLGIGPYTRLFAVGLFFTGIGNVFVGLTNGFTDMTPIGRRLFQIALGSFAVGVPVLGYFIYHLV